MGECPDTGNCIGAQPPAEAVQEFKVTPVSFDAQPGHMAGANIDVAICSDTNNFHSTLYELAKKINFTGCKIESICFSPDSRCRLFAGHDQHIRVLRVGAWHSVFLSEPVHHLEYSSFSRNDSFLALAHPDGLRAPRPGCGAEPG